MHVGLLLGLVTGACKREEPAPAAEPPPAAAASPCPQGRSDDPPRAKLVQAHRLFRAQKYSEARTLLDHLLAEKPNSATALALRGDAILFDEELGYVAAARQARADYDRALGLLAQGCGVQRRVEYYLHMGDTFAALRLAPREDGSFDAAELERAERALRRAEQRWPESAEVHYNLARVHCARPQELDACVERLERALEVAESRERPRFLRTHRSTEDWVVRSESQSEFGALRKDPRYAAAVANARSRRGQAEELRAQTQEQQADRRRSRPRGPGGGRLRPDPKPPSAQPME